MGIMFTNDANSTLRTSINTSVTTVVVASGDGAMFPQPVTGVDYFMLVLEDRTQNPILREICKCTGRSTDTLTVVRAQESTTAKAFAAGVIVSHRITAGTLVTLRQSGTISTTLYLGAFATAPTAGVSGAVLVPGNLYFDTTQNKLFVFDGAFWLEVAAGATNTGFGMYLGSHSLAPLTMLDGSALVAGSLYYNPTTPALFEWDGSAWVNITTAGGGTTNTSNNIDGNVSIGGNLTVGGDETVHGDITCDNITVHHVTRTETLYLDGNLVVDAGDVSGASNFQNWPAGTMIQWGVVTTAGGTAGFTAITFPAGPFGSVPVVMVSAANHAGSDGLVPTWGAVTPNGFNVGNLKGAQLSWYAIGNQVAP